MLDASIQRLVRVFCSRCIQGTMSSFNIFHFCDELNKAGFAPVHQSLKTIANACAATGAETINDMVGMKIAELAEMKGVHCQDQTRLQVVYVFCSLRIKYLLVRFSQEIINRRDTVEQVKVRPQQCEVLWPCDGASVVIEFPS